MSGSKEFQDAESTRSGNSHVTSQPLLFPEHPIPEGMLRPSFVSPRRKEGPPCIWDMVYRETFCKSRCVFCSNLSAGIESMEFRHVRTDSLINGGEEWESNTSSRSEMPVWTVSQKFSHPSVRGRLSKEIWGRPTTTADFGSSFRQIPFTSYTFACLKIKFKTEVCTCSQFPTEATQWLTQWMI